MLIVAKDIEKNYGPLQVLKGVNLAIQEAEVVSIVGPSGAGKSTLLHILGTLDSPDKGELTIKGTEVHRLRGNKLADFRNKQIGFVFQFHHLLPEFSAIENVCIPAFITNFNRSASEKRAAELLDLLGMTNRMQHKPSQLSGGEQQRVAVARALMNQPALILADEPSGNLDTANAADLHRLFFKLRDDLKQTFVIVTHNDELAAMADRTLSMKDGRIVSGS